VLVARLTQLAGQVYGPWEKFSEITMNYGGLRIDKAGVKMTLEHHKDALDCGIRGGRRC